MSPKLPDDLRPICKADGLFMRPLYYTPAGSEVRQRAKGLWFCPDCREIREYERPVPAVPANPFP